MNAEITLFLDGQEIPLTGYHLDVKPDPATQRPSCLLHLSFFLEGREDILAWAINERTPKDGQILMKGFASQQGSLRRVSFRGAHCHLHVQEEVGKRAVVMLTLTPEEIKFASSRT